jgi:hypothetical protein
MLVESDTFFQRKVCHDLRDLAGISSWIFFSELSLCRRGWQVRDVWHLVQQTGMYHGAIIVHATDGLRTKIASHFQIAGWLGSTVAWCMHCSAC